MGTKAKVATNTESGKVKFFNIAKGFGFLIDDKDSKEYFFHFTGMIDKKIVADDEITFSLEETERGFRAVNIKLKNKENGK
jgi:CspA family cold shock protein